MALEQDAGPLGGDGRGTGLAGAAQQDAQPAQGIGLASVVAGLVPVVDGVAEQHTGLLHAGAGGQGVAQLGLQLGPFVRVEGVAHREGSLTVAHGLPIRGAVGGEVAGPAGRPGEGKVVAGQLGVVDNAGGVHARMDLERRHDPAVQVAASRHRELGLHREPPQLVPEGEGTVLVDEHAARDAGVEVGGGRLAHCLDEPLLGPSGDDGDGIEHGAGAGVESCRPGQHCQPYR